MLGAIIGLTGMLVRGNKRPHIITAAIASTAGVLVTGIVSFVEERFGLLILVGAALAMAWVIQKVEELVWKKL